MSVLYVSLSVNFALIEMLTHLKSLKIVLRKEKLNMKLKRKLKMKKDSKKMLDKEKLILTVMQVLKKDYQGSEGKYSLDQYLCVPAATKDCLKIK